MKRLVANLTIYLLAHFSSHAQEISKISTPDHDTTYYRSFKGTIIGRVYLSRNYMQFKLDPAAGIPEMSYRANKPLSLGVGITYKSFSFSFSKGLNFLQSNKRKGATRSTDCNCICTSGNGPSMRWRNSIGDIISTRAAWVLPMAGPITSVLI